MVGAQRPTHFSEVSTTQTPQPRCRISNRSDWSIPWMACYQSDLALHLHDILIWTSWKVLSLASYPISVWRSSTQRWATMPAQQKDDSEPAVPWILWRMTRDFRCPMHYRRCYSNEPYPRHRNIRVFAAGMILSIQKIILPSIVFGSQMRLERIRHKSVFWGVHEFGSWKQGAFFYTASFCPMSCCAHQINLVDRFQDLLPTEDNLVNWKQTLRINTQTRLVIWPGWCASIAVSSIYDTPEEVQP